MSTFEERMAKRIAKLNKERADEDELAVKGFAEMDRRREAKAKVALPKYKVEEKDPSYKMKRGTVMKASSDLHDDKSGKRYITTNMKIYSGLTDKDKASLKKSIMIALEHKFKGGSISDFPKDIVGVVNSIHKHFKGRADQIKAPKAAQGKELVPNYIKPKGTRQMIYFDSDSDSDTSSSDDDPYLPIKRGRGRPRKC
jgi:hypothetical protein